MNWAKFRAMPVIDEDTMQKCRESGDFREVAFVLYRHIGHLATDFASLKDAGGMRSINPRDYAALIGLLIRCAKLMRANLRLSAERGGCGEVTTIVDRSIIESACKIRWLCQLGTEGFDRFVADGLKAELELREKIRKNIADRGHVLIIEKRMLNSIADTLDKSKMSASEIGGMKVIPNFGAMLAMLKRDPLTYTVYQRIGSHAVHGTWAGLLLQYLKEDEYGTLIPRDIDVDTDINQYIGVALEVLESLESFAQFVSSTQLTLDALLKSIESARASILQLVNEIASADYAETK